MANSGHDDDFRLISACVPVHLPTSRLANVDSGVREQLNQYLLRYLPTRVYVCIYVCMGWSGKRERRNKRCKCGQ
jgi:hypothetical protein